MRDSVRTRLYQDMLKAFIRAAKAGASAKDCHAFLNEAQEGMRINAAFSMPSDELADNLQRELAS